jgi:hypothetical protein
MWLLMNYGNFVLHESEEEKLLVAKLYSSGN